MKETKAEKIFKDTYTECRVHAKTWGFEYNANGKIIGFNKLATEEVTCKRTTNAIQALLNGERKNLEIYRKYGMEKEKYEFLSKALDMVQSTLENHMNW